MRSEEICVGVSAGRFGVAGSWGTTEYHCDDGEKVNFVEDLGWFGFEGGTWEPLSLFLGDF